MALYYSGNDDDGEWFTLFYSGFGGVPGRPIGDGHDGYTLLPSFFNLPTEVAESYAPVRVEQYSIVPDSSGPGLHRGGNGNHLVFYFDSSSRHWLVKRLYTYVPTCSGG